MNKVKRKTVTNLIVVCAVTALSTGCAALPQLGQDITTIATDNAVKVEIQKEALQPNTNAKVTIEITNKEAKI